MKVCIDHTNIDDQASGRWCRLPPSHTSRNDTARLDTFDANSHRMLIHHNPKRETLSHQSAASQFDAISTTTMSTTTVIVAKQRHLGQTELITCASLRVYRYHTAQKKKLSAPRNRDKHNIVQSRK